MLRRKSQRNEVKEANKRNDTDLGLDVHTFQRVLSHTSKYWGMYTAGCVCGLLKQVHQKCRLHIASKCTYILDEKFKIF